MLLSKFAADIDRLAAMKKLLLSIAFSAFIGANATAAPRKVKELLRVGERD